jgi:hypothetical protein
MVGEFGSMPAGSTDWHGLVEHAKKLGWPVLAWAWNGCGQGMNMITPYWKTNPSAGHFTPSGYGKELLPML